MARRADELRAMDEALALDPGLAERLKSRARKRLISLRLAQWQIDTAKRLAKRRKQPYQTLLRAFVADGLKHELGS